MLTDVVANEVLRYLYLASLRPLVTLAAFTALVVLVVVLAALAWEGQRFRAGRARRVPPRLDRSSVAILVLGGLSLLLPPLLP